MARDHDQASGVHAPAAETAGADALSDVLEVVKLTGALFFLVEASPPWAAEVPDSKALATAILPRVRHVVSFHVVTEGVCWFHMAGEAPIALQAGEVIVVPHGDAYAMSTSASLRSAGLTLDQTLLWFGQMASGELPFVVEEGSDGPERIRIICGFLGCDSLPFNPVLAPLPRWLRVRRLPAERSDGLDHLVELAVGESRRPRPGSRSVLLRIAELMFVEVVRRHLTSVTAEERGWLAGLRDPVVGRALACLHREPDQSWTVEKLAREVAASRSLLSERFTDFVGEPPMHYLARWRMQLPARRLAADPSAKVSAVAREVGYESEAAFSRAFKKLTGIPPVAWRNRA